MFKSIVPISKESHGTKKIKPISSYAFAANTHLASIMVHEFYRAASMYPIVFLEDKEHDDFRPVILLGLEPNENLFIDANGKWTVSYIPAIIRRYPFALAKTPEDNKYTVCIDEESDLVSEEEGEPLFDEKGEPTKVIENVKKYLGELQQMDALTSQFIKMLKEKNMFTPLNMRVREADTVRNVTGCYVINEQRLNNLSDETFLDLKKKSLLAPIYSHLVSLGQIERLFSLKKKKAGAGPVNTIQ
ncbi:MAG: SapC family protein [Desulfoplanes sp.]|nr:SapC family protein [Desulfoplanes sp.]